MQKIEQYQNAYIAEQSNVVTTDDYLCDTYIDRVTGFTVSFFDSNNKYIMADNSDDIIFDTNVEKCDFIDDEYQFIRIGSMDEMIRLCDKMHEENTIYFCCNPDHNSIEHIFLANFHECEGRNAVLFYWSKSLQLPCKTIDTATTESTIESTVAHFDTVVWSNILSFIDDKYMIAYCSINTITFQVCTPFLRNVFDVNGSFPTWAIDHSGQLIVPDIDEEYYEYIGEEYCGRMLYFKTVAGRHYFFKNVHDVTYLNDMMIAGNYRAAAVKPCYTIFGTTVPVIFRDGPLHKSHKVYDSMSGICMNMRSRYSDTLSYKLIDDIYGAKQKNIFVAANMNDLFNDVDNIWGKTITFGNDGSIESILMRDAVYIIGFAT